MTAAVGIGVHSERRGPRRLQVNLLDWSGGVLAVLVGGSIAAWDRTLEVANPVVDSLRIVD